MPITQHVRDRLSERLHGVVDDPESVISGVVDIADGKSGSAAILIARLPRAFGDNSANKNTRDSNGDEIWVIARDGRIITIMLRRAAQPKTCDRFDTDVVVDFTSGRLVFLDSKCQSSYS
jgi:hypothetical protein